jgi:integrase
VNASELWNVVADPTDRGHRKAHQRYVVQVIKKHFPVLHAGKGGIKISQDEVDDLTDRLTDGKSQLITSFRLKYLNSVLRTGIRELGWEIPLATIPTVLPRTPSPFTAKAFSRTGQMRSFESAFIASLAASPTSLKASAGQMLLSAVLFGGLLREKNWDSWLRAAGNFDGRSVSIDPGDDAPPIRWFADPVTARLLERWGKIYESVPTQAPNKAWVCIRAAMADAAFDGVKPASAAELRGWAELRLRMIVPGYLADYASGGGPSVSLPDEAWRRLVTGQMAVQAARADETTSFTVVSPLAPAKPAAPRDGVTVLRSLRAALRVFARGTDKPSRAAAASAVEKLIKSYGPAAQTIELILKWVHVRLTQPKQYGGLAPESIGRYLTPLAEPLITFAGSDDWSMYEGEDVTELYQGVISSRETDSEKAMAGLALENFHDVVVRLLPSLAIDMSEIRPGSVRGQVNANIVSGPEYLNAKRKLVRSSMTWRAQIPGVVLILGYRAGLRRKEALRLPLSCLRMNADTIELTIRKTRFGGLKSPASTRRLPLGALLDKAETAFIRKWLASRPTSLLKSGDQLLFCDGSDPMTPLSEAEVFQPIRAALIAATGDANIRFHNLRHSFATFLLLTLTLPTGVDLKWLHGIDADIVSDKRRRRMSSALLGEGGLGRAALHAVSQACGHSDVRVTLASYMHLADFALCSLLSQNSVQPVMPTKIHAAVGGVSESAVRVGEHRLRKKTGIPRSIDPAHQVDKAKPTLASHRNDPARNAHMDDGIATRRSKGLVELKPATETNLPAIDFIQNVIEALHAGKAPEDCARSLDVNIEDIIRWSQRARDLGAMQTQKGGYRHRSVGKAKIEDNLFPSAALKTPEMDDANEMWARISAKTDGDELHSAALCLFAHRYQSTGGRVRIVDHHEHTAYEQFLAALGVAEARIVWTPSPDSNAPRLARTKATLAADKVGYFTVKSACDEAASAGFNYVTKMLIIAGNFAFLELPATLQSMLATPQTFRKDRSDGLATKSR